MNYDYLSASDGTGDAPLMHVTGTRLVGGTTIPVDSVAKVPAKFIATSGTLLPTGYIDPTTKTDFYGHVTGGNLIIEGFAPGNTDIGNTAAQVVVVKPNTHWANSVITQAQVSHNNDGTIKNGSVSLAAMLGTGVVTSAAILDGTIAYADLLSTIFGSQVQSQANAGSAGGTMYYINLGGIKLLWGLSSRIAIAGSGLQATLGMAVISPTSFFTTIQSAVLTTSDITNTQYLNAVTTTTTTATGLAFELVQTNGINGTATVAFFVIGT